MIIKSYLIIILLLYYFLNSHLFNILFLNSLNDIFFNDGLFLSFILLVLSFILSLL